jgi:CRP-like cAMP-binding protein
VAAQLHSLTVPDVLRSAGIDHRRVAYRQGGVIFTQGDACTHIRFIESGSVKVSVMSATGKDGVVATLGVGDFLGEGSLAGQPYHTHSATAITTSTIVAVGKSDMLQLLRQEPAMSDRFIAHLLARNIRSESDLVDHLFNGCQLRLARTLLLLAGYGNASPSKEVTLTITQDTLAAMVGTTRPRINRFLGHFKQRGFVEYVGPSVIKINPSLVAMVVDDGRS